MRWCSRASRRERLPELSPPGDLVLVADARIDNRDALIKALALLDYPSEEISDGRLILKAYQTWGEDCPDKLEGDFAFAIWDAPRQRLFCARDAAGVKPFYYFSSPHLFAFASEIKALWAIPEIPRQLNERKLADYLLWSFEDTQDTFYQNIHRLPPAFTLTVRSEEKQVKQYWALDPQREIRLENDTAYIESFREIFNEAVRCRANGVDHLGSTLSGGLDSSSIACTARQQLAHGNNLPVKVFSAVYPGATEGQWGGIDERFFIEEVLATGSFEAHYVDASQLNPLIDPDQLYHVLDEPYFAPTLYMFWGLFQAAQQAGVEVLLDGTDGDRTISHGETYLTELARSGRWLEFHRQATALAKVQRVHGKLRHLVWRYGIRPFIPPALVDIKHQLVKSRRTASARDRIIRPEFAQRIRLTDSPAAGPVNGRVMPRSAREEHWRELASGINAYSLELFDKAASAFNIEMRFPFYDRRLMEFCLALPGEQKLSDGWTRYILRAGMQEILPEKVCWRTSKSNVFQAFNRQLQSIGREGLDHRVVESARILEEYLDKNNLESIYADYWVQTSQRLVNAYYIFSIISLAGWMKSAGIAR
jgi:asparagine synthase (glutamine-hydrolysing)